MRLSTITGIALAASLALVSSQAAAQASGNLQVKDATGTTRNVAGQTDANGAFHYRHLLEGLTTGAAPDPLITDGAGHIAVLQSGTWSFGLTGTLPAFGTPPTFNLGTLNGAATSALQQSILTALGTPLQAGGFVTVTGGPTAAAQTTANGSLASIVANTTPAGAGSMSAVPAGSTNGTALGCSASGFKGARFYLGTSDTVTFTVATAAPSTAPASTYTISGATSGTGPNWDESLGGSAAIYVTAKGGSPLFRCY